MKLGEGHSRILVSILTKKKARGRNVPFLFSRRFLFINILNCVLYFPWIVDFLVLLHGALPYPGISGGPRGLLYTFVSACRCLPRGVVGMIEGPFKPSIAGLAIPPLEV